MTFTKEQITEWVKDASGLVVIGLLMYSNFNSQQIQISQNILEIKQIRETRYKQSDADKDLQIINQKLNNLHWKIDDLASDINDLKKR